ncbi:MAG TPA: LacI family DNA-binding transcriptional regulator [Bacillales bacterium]|nr:LacI family DNA-binding transcriptional regulator [Bacillales bacterium]HEU5139363.1 LacI family DNA-binding transcriptional regulator [Bacillales bacterium]
MSTIDIRKIAKEAGVSVSTVSKALNGYKDIKEETRLKVLRIAKELDYIPNVMARGLITKTTNTIGVFFGDQTNSGFDSPFLSDYFASIKNAVGEAGYDLLIFSNQKRETPSFKSICYEKGVDGVILILTGKRRTDEKIHELHEFFPTVYIDSLPFNKMKVNFVESDNELGAYEATKHLINLGHRNILKIAGDTIAKGSFDRIEGYKLALEEFEIGFNKELVKYGEFSREKAYEATKEFFSQPNDVTAVFASSDVMAFGVMDALKDLDLKVPDEVSVVGFDDIEEAKYARPPLTTVHQQRFEIGETAANILLDLIQKKDGVTRHISIPPQLVVRKSCKEV